MGQPEWFGRIYRFEPRQHSSSGGKNSISHEVVDSGEFVLNLIGRVCIYLSVLALPVVLVSGQTRTRLGEFSPAAPDRGAPPAGAQTQTAGQGPVVLGGPEKRVAKLACRVNDLLTRDCNRLATSWVQDVLALEVPASWWTSPKGCRADRAREVKSSNWSIHKDLWGVQRVDVGPLPCSTLAR